MITKNLYPSTGLKFCGLILGSSLITAIPVFVFFPNEINGSSIFFKTILFVSFISISIGYAHYRNIKNNTPITYQFKINNIRLLPLMVLIIATFSIGLVVPMAGIIGNLLGIGAQQNPLDSPLLLTFGALLLAPVMEEVLFRGILFRGLTSSYSAKKAVIISAIIFALLHLNPVQLLPAFLLGLFFGFLYMKTNSLGLVILLHFTANFTALIGEYLSYMLHDASDMPYFNCYGSYTIYIVGISVILFTTLCYFFYAKVSSLVRFDICKKLVKRRRGYFANDLWGKNTYL